MSTLAELPSGARAQVAALPAHHGLARRLIALGLTPGAEVCVLQNRGRGPLIVEAHGARIALGRKQADRVSIDLDPDPCESLDNQSGAVDGLGETGLSSAESASGGAVTAEDILVDPVAMDAVLAEIAPVHTASRAVGRGWRRHRRDRY